MKEMHDLMITMEAAFEKLTPKLREQLFFRFWNRIERQNNTTLYCLRIAAGIHGLLQRNGFDCKDRVIFELGAGDPVGAAIYWLSKGARRYIAVDKYVPAGLSKARLEQYAAILRYSFGAGLRLNDLFTQQGDEMVPDPDRIELVQADFLDYPVSPAGVDAIYSNAVFEHVAQPERTVRKCAYMLRADGIFYSNIDLSAHFDYTGERSRATDHYRLSREEWEARYTPGASKYINRLRASDWRRVFRENGFSLLSESTTQNDAAYGEEVYDQIHPEFRRYSLEDLKTINYRPLARSVVHASAAS